MTKIRLLAVIEATTVTGPAKNILSLARLLRSSEFQNNDIAGIELSVVTFHRMVGDRLDDAKEYTDTMGTPNAFVAATREQGVDVDVILERYRFDPRVIGQLRRIVARRVPDIVQTHMVKSHFLTKLSGIGHQYPWIAYHHGYTTTDLKMRGYNQLNRWSLPSAARVITVCRPFAEQLSCAGVRRDRIVVCHNSVVAPTPVLPQAKHELRQRLGLREGERVVLAVGRLSREKGHVDLVRALRVLRELNPELIFKLVIVGEGPERMRVEGVARDCGLVDSLVFAGQIDYVQTFYAISDVVALPSHSEGSPNVLLEAMAAGLPVVATAVGGVPEIATDEKNALLVKRKEVEAFAGALNRVLSDYVLASRLGHAAAKHVTDTFSPKAYVRSLLRVYQGVAGERVKLPPLQTSP